MTREYAETILCLHLILPHSKRYRNMSSQKNDSLNHKMNSQKRGEKKGLQLYKCQHFV